MSYYANYYGNVCFRQPRNQNEIVRLLEKDLDCDHNWIDFDYVSSGEVIGCRFSGSVNYHEDEVYDFLNSFGCSEGIVEFKGEDGSLWAAVLGDNCWYEKQGKIIYDDKRFVLVRTNGYEIDKVSDYSCIDEARQDMIKDYNLYKPDLFTDKDYEDQSFLNDDEALLYNNGYDVFCWKILEVSNA